MIVTDERKELVSIAEAARQLGIARSTIANWGRRGKIQLYRPELYQVTLVDLVELRRKMLVLPVRIDQPKEGSQ